MTTKPPWAAAFVQSLEEEIDEIKRLHLEPLESGGMTIRQSGVDITQREITSLRKNIASIEAVIAQYRDAEDE
jgi:polyhydroxyalkanoate synthesis regulator phasin